MNLFRLIILALAVWLVMRFVRRLRVTPPPTGRPANRMTGNMVRCAACGLHLPEPEALAEGDSYFCCEEHRPRTGST